MTCLTPNCPNPVHTRGRCKPCDARWRRSDDYVPAYLTVKVKPLCSVEGCGRNAKAKGMCDRHYWAANWRSYPSGQKRLAGVKRLKTKPTILKCEGTDQ